MRNPETLTTPWGSYMTSNALAKFVLFIFFKKIPSVFLGMRRIEKTKQHPEFFKKNYRRVCKRQKRDNI
jgi:hypothetical protein